MSEKRDVPVLQLSSPTMGSGNNTAPTSPRMDSPKKEEVISMDSLAEIQISKCAHIIGNNANDKVIFFLKILNSKKINQKQKKMFLTNSFKIQTNSVYFFLTPKNFAYIKKMFPVGVGKNSNKFTLKNIFYIRTNSP